jgi:ABC-type sugar transport system substrate-binding protein
MKTTKRFLLTLAAILGMTGAWAQDADEVAVTKTANNNEWTLTMPAGNVELEVEYYEGSQEGPVHRRWQEGRD